MLNQLLRKKQVGAVFNDNSIVMTLHMYFVVLINSSGTKSMVFCGYSYSCAYGEFANSAVIAFYCKKIISPNCWTFAEFIRYYKRGMYP